MSSPTLYQLIFGDQALKELYKLEPALQFELMDKLSQLKPRDLQKNGSSMGSFQRDGKTYYRFRANDFRIYLEIEGDIIHCRYILPHHSFSDFLFRFKLPISEEQMAEQHQSFWKYLDSLK